MSREISYLRSLPTPALLLDAAKMRANIARLRDRLGGLPLRLHCKTAKSVDAALACQGATRAPIAVSTLAEAEYFAAAGFSDIVYAVGIAPTRLARAMRLQISGVDLKICLDCVEMAREVAAFAAGKAHVFSILVEIDCDGHRGGVAADAPELLEIAAILTSAGQRVAGVLTHAGAAYELAAPSPAAFCELARQEAASARLAAQRLRAAGHACAIVSAGSTPTALFGDDFAGLTDLRAGVFPFMDCVMAAMHVCRLENIALSVLATVIGRRQRDGAMIIDAGWTALSQDRGADFERFGYGLVADAAGNIIPGLRVAELNQEHGIVAAQAALRPGQLLRILPAHACAAASSFAEIHVLENNAASATWPRCRGW